MTDLIAKAYIDWNNDGDFADTGEDISDYLLSVSIVAGFSNPNDPRNRVADIGTCTLELNNSDKRFSPDYAAGAYYGTLLPMRPVKVEFHYGASSWTVFRGVINDITPDADQYGPQRATISCIDFLGVMQASSMVLPLVEDQTADYLIAWINSTVFRTDFATGTITIASVPEAGDTVIIDGVEYEFSTTVGTVHVLIGADEDESATNLAAAINLLETGYGSTYGASRTPHPTVTATVSTDTVTLQPIVRGTWGNAITLSAINLEYHADSYTVNAGGAAGALTATYAQDGSYFVINETATTPGFQVEFEFDDVNGTAETLTFYGQYTGATGHNIDVDAWNDGATRWDNIGTLDHTGSDDTQSWALLAAHTAANTVTVRFNHTSAGTASHVVNVDHLYITSSTDDTPASLTLSGATLSGGVDGPEDLNDYEAGVQVLSEAADLWRDGKTNGLTAATAATESEYGRLWVARDGTVTFVNKDWDFLQYVATPVLTIDDDQTGQGGSITIQSVFTRSIVSYQPRSESSTQVVGKATHPLYVPGNMTTATRFNPSDDRTWGAARTYTIPFVETGTTAIVGAKDFVLPLDPGTDYTVWDNKAGTGTERTDDGLLLFSVAQTGGGLEVTIANTSPMNVYVHDLQVRATAIQSFNPVQVVLDDTSAQDTYGRRELSYTIPFPSANVEVFAEVLAQYLLGRYKTPVFRLNGITFTGVIEVGGVNVYSVEIGDVLDVSETQTAVSSYLELVLGIEYRVTAGENPEVRFLTRRVDDTQYWILEDADSELGVNTYLGL